MISVFSLSLIILENTLAAVEGRPAATDGQQFLKDVAAGSKMSDKPGYLQFTAPYMLCDGDCTVDEEYNFVMSFPLFVGKFGKEKYKKMFSQDYKKIHSKNSEAPFRTRTTKVYTLCKRGSSTVKSTKVISGKNIARSKRTTITKTTKRPNIKDHITKKITTVKATTVKAITVKAITVKATTVKATTVKANTVKATIVKATTEEVTTEELTTKELTTEEATTEEATTEEATTEEVTTEEPTTKELTTDEPTTKDLTTEDLTVEEPITDFLLLTLPEPTESFVTPSIKVEHPTTPLYPNVSKKKCPNILPGMCVKRISPDMWYTEDYDYLFTAPVYDTPRIVYLQEK